MAHPLIKVIIPAYNEADSIALVVRDIPKDLVDEVIVVNNNSTDATAQKAREAGATVLDEPVPGYGKACLKGMAYIAAQEQKPEIVVFLDGDYSDYPEEMEKVVQPIIENRADLVIGSRKLGQKEKGSMTVPQVFGNWLSIFLLKTIYKVTYTDLGPFRAIKYSSLVQLGMKDENYGWTVEMQLKAAKQKLSTAEVPVNYRKRIGKSKVSGTIKGTFMAGYKILYTIFRYM